MELTLKLNKLFRSVKLDRQKVALQAD